MSKPSETRPGPAPQKRGRGRPPGSKARPRAGTGSQAQAEGQAEGSGAQLADAGAAGPELADEPAPGEAVLLEVEPVGAVPDDGGDLDDEPAAAAPGPSLAGFAAAVPTSAAAYVLTMWECLAIGLIGPDAGLLPNERQMIEPAIRRIIGRLSPDVAGLASQWGDYIMLAVGLAMYGQRLATARRGPPASRSDPDPAAPFGGAPTFTREPTPTPAAADGQLVGNLIGGDWRSVFDRAVAEAGDV